jgi:hypothetical protein
MKSGVLGSGQPGVVGNVVSVLPIVQDIVHARVRFHNENFERSIRHDDIDIPASLTSHSASDIQAAPGNLEVELGWLECDPHK